MNTDLNHVDFGMSAATLTEEEELLVERLVDNELSESERNDLLFRLDETVDGWRFCALTFLEAQAFRAAMRNSTGAESPLPFADASKSTPLANRKVSKSNAKTKRSSIGARKIMNLIATTAVVFAFGYVTVRAPENFSCSAPPSAPREFQEEAEFAMSQSEDDDATDDNAVTKPESNVENSVAENNNNVVENNFADDKIVSERSSVALADQSQQSLAPLRFDSERSIAMNGAKGGAMGFDESDDTSSSRRRIKVKAGLSKETADALSGDLESAEINDFDQIADSNVYAENVNRAPEAARAPVHDPTMTRLANSGAIKTARFSSPSRGLENVEVPYAEADSYDSSASRAFLEANSIVPHELAERVRNAGGRLESNRTQYRFPLEDGRVLIVPVDDYSVSYDEDRPIW